MSESLEDTFKRLVGEQEAKDAIRTDRESVNLGLCGHARKCSVLIMGRLCDLTEIACFNYNIEEIVGKCPILKERTE